jgi:hypothetical protein
MAAVVFLVVVVLAVSRTIRRAAEVVVQQNRFTHVVCKEYVCSEECQLGLVV